MNSQNIDELFERTLRDGYDDDLPWNAVRELRHIGSREIFDKAAEWCNAENPLVRARGSDVLAQLGKTAGHPTNNFSEESFSVVSQLIKTEGDPLPLSSAIVALGHINNPRGIPLIVQHCRHPDSQVRFSVACALGSFALLDDRHATEALLALTEDSDADVRDWATFGLGVLGTSDCPEIRDALLRRIDDSEEDAREEAIVGLSKRKDLRVLSHLIAALEQPTITDRLREAADEMLGVAQDRVNWSAHDYVTALHHQFASQLRRSKS